MGAAAPTEVEIGEHRSGKIEGEEGDYLHIYHHYDVSGIKSTMSVTHVSVTQCKMPSVIMVNM